jgi:hypothetical protein
MLARGSGIAAIRPIMGETFSRRALYRHREKHMIHALAPAARPVAFPRTSDLRDQLRWLLQEVEHTAALAEARGNLSLKLKAQHEMARIIWLESRLGRDPEPADDSASSALSELELLELPEGWKIFNQLRAHRRARREAAQKGIVPEHEEDR